MKLTIPAAGFDVTPEILAAIEAGTLAATADQQPYTQSYFAVTQMAMYLKYGLYPSDMATGGAGLLDKTNIGKATAFAGTYR